MIIIRRSKDQHLILHNLITHMKRTLSLKEEKGILKLVPELKDSNIDSWLLDEVPDELKLKFERMN